MFWITKSYEIPAFNIDTELRLKSFAKKNEFQFSSDSYSKIYTLKKEETLNINNLFSIRLSTRVSGDEVFCEVKLKPQYWVIGSMLLLFVMAIVCIINAEFREVLGMSFPLIIAVPYLYRLYVTRILGELKGTLIPGYLDSAKGRKEIFRSYTNPLKRTLNLQLYLYLAFVVVFISVIILWMLWITDRFFNLP